MLATVGGVGLVGLDGERVRVECSVTNGLPGLRTVGLPDSAVREAGERVRSAVQRSGYGWPDSRIVVNLAPAGRRKVGAGFDLPVALALLSASDQLDPVVLRDVVAFGELGLDGSARPVPGALPVAATVRRGPRSRLLVPESSATEAALVDGVDVVPVADLEEAVDVLTGRRAARRPAEPLDDPEPPPLDLRDVRGQEVARRALELAAAGGHHLVLSGPPGCGKSMLARRLPGLLPPLDLDAALEVATVHSVMGLRALDAPLSRRPPFRDPHHTTSLAGLIGGGSGIARPGEVSCAHRGVLFIDELLEVPRRTLDALREPLETGEVTIVRSMGSVRYPARILLVAATNPCPCGYFTGDDRRCRCRPDQIDRYRSRLSGPLLDRFDLQVELRPVPAELLAGPATAEPTEVVAARVLAARRRAEERWGCGGTNRDAPIDAVRETCDASAVRLLQDAVVGLGLSARAFDRCLRVARTIADLDATDVVDTVHVEEAVAYRLPTRSAWAA